MKKLAIILVCIFSFQMLSFAQILDPVQGPRVYKKENVKEKKAPELANVREADAIWSTRIWREIDLRQKANHPLYYPLDSVFHGKRSFIQVIMDEFVNNPNNVGPSAVKFYEDDQLLIEVPIESIRNFILRSDSVEINDQNCIPEKKWVTNDFIKIKPSLTKIYIMEDWFIDKQRSVQDVRILAIGFKIPYVEIKNEPDPQCNGTSTFTGFGQPDMEKGKVYWMFFPQIRPVLAQVETYNRLNDAMRLSYDDLFLQRIFASYITKQENAYNRNINDYSAGLDALLESERIKNEIFTYEQDLWEY